MNDYIYPTYVRTELGWHAGSHTIGRARCVSFRTRIYNEPSTIDSSFAKALQRKCQRVNGVNDNELAPLDIRTSTHFDIQYYKNLLNKKGLLHSDQELYNGTSADSRVKKYAANTTRFFKDFARAMVKMGKIKPLTGSKGEIRINCRKPN
jgi:peroxidase